MASQLRRGGFGEEEMEAWGDFAESSRTRSATKMPNSAGLKWLLLETPKDLYSLILVYVWVQYSKLDSV